MLRSIRELYGKTLGTSEGDIGHVKDFYFNDQHWVELSESQPSPKDNRVNHLRDWSHFLGNRK